MRYWVYFTDKAASAHLMESPEAFLSAKAIERRRRQGIPINGSDLPVPPSYIASLKALGIPVIRTSKWLNAASVSISDPVQLDHIQQLPHVKQVKGVRKYKRTVEETMQESFDIPAKTSFKTAALPYGLSQHQVNMVGGIGLHDDGYLGEGMTIGVLDGGFGNINILPAFDSLWAYNRVKGTYDFVDNDTVVLNGGFHGTSVLSVMGAYLANQMVGTAPRADYWLFRTENEFSERITEEDNWVAAAEFADSVGVDVINSSLGYNTFDNSSDDHVYADMDGNTTIITRGADMAAQKGILVVVSAGNEGQSFWQYITAPADGDSVMAVGGVNAMGQHAALSSQGPSADGRVKPNVAAQAEGTMIISSGGGVIASTGTSFASPIIAGLATCLWQSKPGTGNMDVLLAIEQSAHQYNNPDHLLGYGIPNFQTARSLLNVSDRALPDEAVTVYPNPFQDRIRISFKDSHSKEAGVQIFNHLGHLVFEKDYVLKGNSFSIAPGDEALPRGIYFLELTTDHHTYTTKLIH